MAAEAIEESEDQWIQYFTRRYDRKALTERLVESVEPKSVAINYFGERILPYSNFYLKLRRALDRWCRKGWLYKPLRYAAWAALAMTPAASRLFLRTWNERQAGAAGRIPGGAVVVLELHQ
jgi:hypothetical protein